VWGLQGKLESWIQGFEEELLSRSVLPPTLQNRVIRCSLRLRYFFHRVHVNLYGWADEWVGMTKEEIDGYVRKCQEDLKKLAEKKRNKSDEKEEKVEEETDVKKSKSKK